MSNRYAKGLVLCLGFCLLLGGCKNRKEEERQQQQEPPPTAPYTEAAGGELPAPERDRAGAESEAAGDVAESPRRQAASEPPAVSEPAAEQNEAEPAASSPAEGENVPAAGSGAVAAASGTAPQNGAEAAAPGRVLAADSPSDSRQIESGVLTLLNDLRREGERAPLEMDASLRWAAQIRAQEVLTSPTHVRPDGAPYHTAMDEAGYDYAGKYHGENLCVLRYPAKIDNETVAADIVAQFEASPGHRSNMLRDSFDLAGIGVFEQEQADGWTVTCVQLFAGV